MIIGATAVLLAIVIGGLFFRLSIQKTRGRLSSAPAAAPIESLAVLPLANFSHDPEQDYFADGMTDELITNLAKIRKLRVISRTSVMPYRGSGKSIRVIGKELGVDAVLEGSVQHSGNRVRITAQLIRAADDTHLWAESYDGDLRDVLSLETEVARAVAKQVQAELTPDEQKRVATVAPQVDPEAYQLYLRGLHAWEQGPGEGAAASQRYFQQAIAKDPKFARAYVGLAFGHNLNAEFQLAKEPARKALELDDTLATAHAALAFAVFNGDWDFTTAGHEFQRALELEPNNATVLHTYALYLEVLGRLEEAISLMRRVLELDPLSPLSNTNLGLMYFSNGQIKEAILQIKIAEELDPKFASAHLALGSLYEHEGEYEDAASEYRKMGDAFGPNSLHLVMASLNASRGRKAEALQQLRQVQSTKVSSADDPYDVAVIYVKLGEKEQAFASLNKAYREHGQNILYLKTEPAFAELRSDPRFQDLLRRIGLPR
jgi:TolB-like protein/Tfp pilus assembly protein PilF